MKKQELQINNYRDTISWAIRNKDEIALYSIIPSNIIYKGKGQINEEVATQNGYEIYNSIDFGGGIVATRGDVIIIIIKKDGWTIGEEFMNLLAQHLQGKGLRAEKSGNDILIDGIYKVASFSSVNIGDSTIYTGIQVCFTADSDLIRQICLKNSTKVPKGLSEYKINQSEIINILNNYIK